MAEQNKLPQQAFDWYDEYAHGDISRRTFMTRMSSLAVCSTMLAGLLPDYAKAEQVSFNDPDIVASYKTFSSPNGYQEGKGYWVSPKDNSKPYPAVLVVHENRGLNPYIKDVARRLAKAGFVAFAPDALHSLGGYPGNDDQGRKMQRSLDKEKIIEDFIAAAKFTSSHTQTTNKLGVVGFCFGGFMSNTLAARIPTIIDAAVPFYGTPADAAYQKNIVSPLLLQFAELDKRVNSTWPDYKKMLDKLNVQYDAYIYPKTNHGFHNDSTSRFDPQAAELAWSRTLEFFEKHLM